MASNSPASPTRVFISGRPPRNVDALLADPLAVDCYDHRQIEFYRTHRAVLEPAWLAHADRADLRHRAYLGRLLLNIGAASGSPLLLDALRGGDEHLQGDVLFELATLPWREGEGLQVPLDQAAAAAALKPFIDASSPRLREQAVRALSRLSGDEILKMKRQMLSHTDPNVRSLVASDLATYHGDAAAWPIIRSVLDMHRGDFHARYSPIGALAGFAANPDPALREEVAQFVRQELGRLAPHTDNNAANEAWSLLRTLEKVAPAWEDEALEAFIASHTTWARGMAFQRLCVRQGAAAAPRVLAALDDPGLVNEMLGLLREQAALYGGPALIEKLQRLLADTQKESQRDQVVDVLIALGETTHPAVLAMIDKVDPWRRWEIASYRDGLTADVMLARLDAAGLLVAADAAARTRFREDWTGGKRSAALFGLLADGGRFGAFDSENSRIPPNYPGLIVELAVLARGAFDVGDVNLYQHGERFEVDVEMAGRMVTIALRDLGDWFDLSALIAGLNDALEDAGLPLRYFSLATTDQMAMVVLGNGAAMAALARDLAFPLGDADEAARRGQDSERAVISLLNASPLGPFVPIRDDANPG